MAFLSYWSIGLHPGANEFFRFLGILFMAVYAAESQVTIITYKPDGNLIYCLVNGCCCAPTYFCGSFGNRLVFEWLVMRHFHLLITDRCFTGFWMVCLSPSSR